MVGQRGVEDLRPTPLRPQLPQTKIQLSPCVIRSESPGEVAINGWYSVCEETMVRNHGVPRRKSTRVEGNAKVATRLAHLAAPQLCFAQNP